jgi:protease-4
MQYNFPPQGIGFQPLPHKKRKGAGFWIALGFAIFFFLCTLLMSVLFLGSLLLGKAFVSTATTPKSEMQFSETFVEKNGEDKIAIISIKGLLTSESAEGLFFDKLSVVEIAKQQLEQAARDKFVKAVLLEVDTPGGGITASDIIYNQIMKFKNSTKKTVVVYMQDVAASGGYYISSAADAIVAHPTTITGSIGVIMPLINITELINRYGVKDNSITSGDMKGIGSPLKQMTAEESAILKTIIDEMYMQFATVVSIGRKMDIEAVKKIADGRIYTGKQALKIGLIDQLGYLEDAIALAKQLTGIAEASIIRYKKPYGLADLFGMMSGRLFQNTTIRLDVSQLQAHGNTKPMYLWNGYSGKE